MDQPIAFVAIAVCNSPQTYAEKLVDLANAVKHPKDRLIMAHGSIPDDKVARVRLALDFVARGNGFVMQAIVEDCSHERIVREVY